MLDESTFIFNSEVVAPIQTDFTFDDRGNDELFVTPRTVSSSNLPIMKASPTNQTTKKKKTKNGNPNGNVGRWTDEEHRLFLEGLRIHGKNWKSISKIVKTRSHVQIRTHAQKFFLKAQKSGVATITSSDMKEQPNLLKKRMLHGPSENSASKRLFLPKVNNAEVFMPKVKSTEEWKAQLGSSFVEEESKTGGIDNNSNHDHGSSVIMNQNSPHYPTSAPTSTKNKRRSSTATTKRKNNHKKSFGEDDREIRGNKENSAFATNMLVTIDDRSSISNNNMMEPHSFELHRSSSDIMDDEEQKFDNSNPSSSMGFSTVPLISGNNQLGIHDEGHSSNPFHQFDLQDFFFEGPVQGGHTLFNHHNNAVNTDDVSHEWLEPPSPRQQYIHHQQIHQHLIQQQHEQSHIDMITPGSSDNETTSQVSSPERDSRDMDPLSQMFMNPTIFDQSMEIDNNQDLVL